jgi:hypothetical protein
MKIWPSIILVLGGSAIVLAATTMPAISNSPPSTQPAVRRGFGNAPSSPNLAEQRFTPRTTPRREFAPSRGLPTIYEEVAVRNIFIKGDQRPPVERPGTNRTPTLEDTYTQPVDLILTGVSLDNIERVAFLENTQQDMVLRVKIGDAISSGKIVGIALDSLDYRTGSGQVIHVLVGDNLAGGEVWGVSGGASSTQPSTQPSLVGPRQPGESMEDYLRRRRAAELH